jgi:hypothetical protein
MTDGQKNFITLIAALVIIGIFAAVIFYVLQMQERQALIDAYGEDVVAMCKAPGGGTSNRANVPASPRPWKVLLLTHGDEVKHEWHDDLGPDLRADDKEELAIVVCVHEQKERVVEEQPYALERGGGTFVVQRVQYYVDIVLLNAETGRRIAEFPVQGNPPDPLPDYYRGSQGSIEKLYGEEVQASSVAFALNWWFDQSPR